MNTDQYEVDLGCPTTDTTSSKPLREATKPLRQSLETALRRSLGSLDRTRLDRRLHEVEELRENGKDRFTERLRSRADKRFARFLQHATTRATTTGAVAGALGLPGQLLDLPLFYIQAFKNIAEVALLFGFDPRDPEEQRFMLGILRIGHLPGARRRRDAVEVLLGRSTQKERELLTGLLCALTPRSFITALPRLLPSRIRLLFPIVGGVLNAQNNGRRMEAIVKTASVAYTLRISDCNEQKSE